jgi:hypothetical protein
MILLALMLPLPCLAGNLTDSLEVALKNAQMHLGMQLEEIGLPGQRGRHMSSPGGSLISSNLAEAVREVAIDCEQLLCAGSADSLLSIAGLDKPSSFDADLPGMLVSSKDSLRKYVPGGIQTLVLLAGINRELLRAFSLLSFAEREELRELVSGFEFWRDQWPDYPVERMLELSGRVKREHLASAGAMMALCTRTIRESGLPSVVTSGKPIFYQTPLGAVVIGTHDDDTYGPAAALLIVDPGGDDSYQLSAAGWPTVAMIVDLGGDDHYNCPDGTGLGGSVMGASWLEDVSGNDTYTSGPFSQGAGILGAGVLIDRQGNDRYRGGYLCQGASFFGIGVLIDLAGNDIYNADFGAQGAGFAAGEALLADLGGDDRYRAGGRFHDWRSSGVTKSFAQGCAAGIRPFAEGGRAVLFDRQGSDSLEISYLGQGAGYWGGSGLLLSGGGDDFYGAERYAQGCGLHFASGALVDLGGGDSYMLEGVGQGAGEDRAWGFMLEAAGDDRYSSVRLARGAGGTGGVGLLLELAGDDTYPAGGQVTGGAGSRTWELPGMGFMLDMRGDDKYGGVDANGQTVSNNIWGARLDFLQSR